jgi:hypothetical protein
LQEWPVATNATNNNDINTSKCLHKFQKTNHPKHLWSLWTILPKQKNWKKQ